MKKIIYTIFTIFLTLELSFILHSIAEAWYIKYMLNRGKLLVDHGFFGKLYCALPAWFSYGLLFVAIIGGYFLSKYWWRVVYVEKRHWRFRKKNNNPAP